jgi:hypothetical protein
MNLPMSDTMQARFGVDSSNTEGLAGLVRAASLTNPENNGNGFSWQAPDLEYSLTTRRLTAPTSSSAANVSLGQHDVRWIIEDTDALVEYVETHGDEQLPVPSSYSNFDTFSPYVAQVDATSGESAYGISAQALENALRTLSGGGRYNNTRYSCIACGEKPWILTGPSGTLLCAHKPISSVDARLHTDPLSLPEDRTIDFTSENPHVRGGLRRVAQNIPAAITSCDNIENYVGTPYHVLSVVDDKDSPYPETEDGNWKIAPDVLARVGRAHGSISAVSERGEEIYPDVAAKTPPHAVGDITDDGLLVGYELFKESQALETYLGCRSLSLPSQSRIGTLNERETLWEVRSE